MADPLSQLGIARRPVYELFGRPDTSQGGWSAASREAAAEDQYLMDQAEQAAEAKRERMRAQQAEQAADEYMGQTEPTARQKFLEENPAIAGSKRYNQIAKYQKALPSYADKTLRNSVAMKISDPEARKVFLDAVDQGKGTFAAKELADTFVAKRKAAGELGKAGYSPEETETILAERHDPAHVNYHISQKKQESILHADPEARALREYHGVLKSQASRDMRDMSNPNFGTVRPETQAELDKIEAMLAEKYKSKFGAGTSASPTERVGGEFGRLPSSMFAPAAPVATPAPAFRPRPGTDAFGLPLETPVPAAPAPVVAPSTQMSNADFARSSAPATPSNNVNPETSAEARKALLKKLGLIKP